MLLARATTKDGHELLIIGLSDANRHRLICGEPIDISTYTSFDDAAPLHIVLFAGATEDTMAVQLAPLISKHTQVVDRREAVQR